MKKIKNKSPLDNRLLNTYYPASEEEIKTAYFQAQTAYKDWQSKTLNHRIKYLTKIRKVISNNLDEIVETVVEDTGKAEVEALVTDILVSLDIIKYYEKNAAQILADEKRSSPGLWLRNKSYISYEPYGVVAIIAPWNFPIQLALVPAISALVAGNAVLLKPSEITPEVGALLEKIFTQAELPPNLIQILQGGAEVGHELINTKPDKIFFTGSVETGKKIMKQAAADLIPVELELGGKDPMIILEDANLKRAVEGAVYGAFSNSGQLCVSIERVYVAQEIYEEFVTKIMARVQKLRVGTGKDVDLGTITYPEQLKVIKEQLKDAKAKGAQIKTEFDLNNYFLNPIVVTNVNHNMRLMQEESFGPILAIMPFSSQQEAVKLANDSKYGLNSSVWSADLTQAKAIAQQLDVGNCYINDVVKNIGNPDLPFGGVKQSGIGKYHGAEGLYSFSQAKSIMINKNKQREINWFPYSEKLYLLVKLLIIIKHSGKSLLTKLKSLLAIGKEYIDSN